MTRSPAAKFSLDKKKNPTCRRHWGGQEQDKVTLINMGRSKDYISPATKNRSRIRLIEYLCQIQTKVIKISKNVTCARQSKTNVGQELKLNSVMFHTSSQFDDYFNGSFFTSTPKRLKKPCKECWGETAWKMYQSWDVTWQGDQDCPWQGAAGRYWVDSSPSSNCAHYNFVYT